MRRRRRTSTDPAQFARNVRKGRLGSAAHSAQRTVGRKPAAAVVVVVVILSEVLTAARGPRTPQRVGRVGASSRARSGWSASSVAGETKTKTAMAVGKRPVGMVARRPRDGRATPAPAAANQRRPAAAGRVPRARGRPVSGRLRLVLASLRCTAAPAGAALAACLLHRTRPRRKTCLSALHTLRLCPRPIPSPVPYIYPDPPTLRQPPPPASAAPASESQCPPPVAACCSVSAFRPPHRRYRPPRSLEFLARRLTSHDPRSLALGLPARDASAGPRHRRPRNQSLRNWPRWPRAAPNNRIEPVRTRQARLGRHACRSDDVGSDCRTVAGRARSVEDGGRAGQALEHPPDDLESAGPRRGRHRRSLVAGGEICARMDLFLPDSGLSGHGDAALSFLDRQAATGALQGGHGATCHAELCLRV